MRMFNEDQKKRNHTQKWKKIFFGNRQYFGPLDLLSIFINRDVFVVLPYIHTIRDAMHHLRAELILKTVLWSKKSCVDSLP